MNFNTTEEPVTLFSFTERTNESADVVQLAKSYILYRIGKSYPYFIFILLYNGNTVIYQVKKGLQKI